MATKQLFLRDHHHHQQQQRIIELQLNESQHVLSHQWHADCSGMLHLCLLSPGPHRKTKTTIVRNDGHCLPQSRTTTDQLVFLWKVKLLEQKCHWAVGCMTDAFVKHRHLVFDNHETFDPSLHVSPPAFARDTKQSIIQWQTTDNDHTEECTLQNNTKSSNGGCQSVFHVCTDGCQTFVSSPFFAGCQNCHALVSDNWLTFIGHALQSCDSWEHAKMWCKQTLLNLILSRMWLLQTILKWQSVPQSAIVSLPAANIPLLVQQKTNSTWHWLSKQMNNWTCQKAHTILSMVLQQVWKWWWLLNLVIQPPICAAPVAACLALCCHCCVSAGAQMQATVLTGTSFRQLFSCASVPQIQKQEWKALFTCFSVPSSTAFTKHKLLNNVTSDGYSSRNFFNKINHWQILCFGSKSAAPSFCAVAESIVIVSLTFRPVVPSFRT